MQHKQFVKTKLAVIKKKNKSVSQLSLLFLGQLEVQ